ncbi:MULTISPECIES: hypothetical protein [Bacillus cereus group]|uniref:hypothetical protein n=1 Tax=Bacillus cereus group TaxID=86661 RepID=UPI00254D3E72|nr:hypothetical protein [Bacillus paranthracis]MDK7489684.1 hypothetical protein [Bacillus paranthracis]
MSEAMEFVDIVILPKLKSTKEYFEETLKQLEGKFTKDEPFAESFSTMMKKSFLITTYSILEKELSMLTRFVDAQDKSLIKLEDLKYRGIYRDYIYLTKVVQFKLPPDDIWKKIQTYNKIRNYFIHDPRVVLNRKEMKKISNSLVPYIKFKREDAKKDRYIIEEIDSYIIIDFLNTVEDFLRFLWSELESQGY